jgi:hypothetical protein
LISLILQYVAIAIGTAGYSTYRYAAPFILATLIYLFQFFNYVSISGLTVVVLIRL